jgi:hypothetical protein
VGLVRGDDDLIVASGRAFDDGCVHDVVVIGPAGEHTDLAGLLGGHRLDVSAGQHAVQARLARASPPRLGDHRREHGRHHLLGDEAGMKGPHATVIAISADQGSGVVGGAGH